MKTDLPDRIKDRFQQLETWLLDLDVDGDGQLDFTLANFATPPYQVTHTYQTEGLYIATMVVRDQTGQSRTTRVPIGVKAHRGSRSWCSGVAYQCANAWKTHGTELVLQCTAPIGCSLSGEKGWTADNSFRRAVRLL